MKQDQTQVLLRVLKGLDKVLTGDDPPLPPAFVRAKAWPSGRESVSTEDLRKAFAQRVGLKMLLDINQLKATIKTGISGGAWVYYDTKEQMGYGKDSPAPLVQIGEDFELYTPAEAERIDLPIKGKERAPEICPVCKQDPCVCGMDGVDIKIKPLKGEGAPAQAFQAAIDQAYDQGVKAVRRLTVSFEGSGKEGMNDVLAMGLAIPQFGKGDYAVHLHLVSEFGEQQYVDVDFRGGWDRYKRLKTVTDAFGQEASKTKVNAKVIATFSDGLPLDGTQYQAMRDILVSLNMGRIVLEAEPHEAGDST